MKKIKCPYCGAEYTPSEIFMPQDFLETSLSVLRDKSGKIEHISCEDACLEESYICDYCDKEFTVKAEIEYVVEQSEEFDDYVIHII